MSDEQDGTYKVGKGRPPLETRFKPGNQAAKGRKRKAGSEKSIATALQSAMAKRRTIRRNGKPERMLPSDIFAERIISIITTGKPREVIAACQILERHAPHLIAGAVEELLVRYERAADSTVDAPPSHLLEGPSE